MARFTKPANASYYRAVNWEPPRRTMLVCAIAGLTLAVNQSRPMAARNTHSRPKAEGMQDEFPNAPPTPDLIGPDPLQPAPVVGVNRNHLSLDGSDGEDLQSLQDKLVTLRNNFKLTRPDEDFNGLAVVVADAATSMPRLFSILKAIRRADYHQVLFAFTKKSTFLAMLKRPSTTGALAGVVYSDWKDKWGDEEDEDAAPWKNGVELRSQDFRDYGAFARRLVELRRQGKPVVVKVERDPR